MPQSLLKGVKDIALFRELKRGLDITTLKGLEKHIEAGTLSLSDPLGALLEIIRPHESARIRDHLQHSTQPYIEEEKLEEIMLRYRATAGEQWVFTHDSYVTIITATQREFTEFIAKWYQRNRIYMPPSNNDIRIRYAEMVELSQPILDDCREMEPEELLERFNISDEEDLVAYPTNGWTLAELIRLSHMMSR